MTWNLHRRGDCGLGRVDAGNHDEAAECGDEPHQHVDHDLDTVDRHPGEARRLPVASDRPHMQAEPRVVEELGAEEGEDEGDDHRHRNAGDVPWPNHVSDDGSP